MLQYLVILAVTLAAYAEASVWAMLCGIAALMLTAIAGENVMTRVLANGDDDVVHYSIRQIVVNAFWASGMAFALGTLIRMAYAG